MMVEPTRVTAVASITELDVGRDYTCEIGNSNSVSVSVPTLAH